MIRHQLAFIGSYLVNFLSGFEDQRTLSAIILEVLVQADLDIGANKRVVRLREKS